mmetsp:Transcript_1022/g.3593  ORF Transcript_1022/g.3593 Transcript_1022/m.3593 type:complete len:254 (-) Transcript_1022:230-991(-)
MSLIQKLRRSLDPRSRHVTMQPDGSLSASQDIGLLHRGEIDPVVSAARLNLQPLQLRCTHILKMRQESCQHLGRSGGLVREPGPVHFVLPLKAMHGAHATDGAHLEPGDLLVERVDVCRLDRHFSLDGVAIDGHCVQLLLSSTRRTRMLLGCLLQLFLQGLNLARQCGCLGQRIGLLQLQAQDGLVPRATEALQFFDAVVQPRYLLDHLLGQAFLLVSLSREAAVRIPQPRGLDLQLDQLLVQGLGATAAEDV